MIPAVENRDTTVLDAVYLIVVIGSFMAFPGNWVAQTVGRYAHKEHVVLLYIHFVLLYCTEFSIRSENVMVNDNNMI